MLACATWGLDNVGASCDPGRRRCVFSTPDRLLAGFARSRRPLFWKTDGSRPRWHMMKCGRGQGHKSCPPPSGRGRGHRLSFLSALTTWQTTSFHIPGLTLGPPCRSSGRTSTQLQRSSPAKTYRDLPCRPRRTRQPLSRLRTASPSPCLTVALAAGRGVTTHCLPLPQGLPPLLQPGPSPGPDRVVPSDQ